MARITQRCQQVFFLTMSSSRPTLLKPGEPLPPIRAELLPSKVDVLKTKAAAERGVGGLPTVTTWPKPSFASG
jgi:hypothetical protein